MLSLSNGALSFRRVVESATGLINLIADLLKGEHINTT